MSTAPADVPAGVPDLPSDVLRGVRAVVVNWRDPDHSLAGGSEVYAWQFARALAEGGADVEFLTAREPGRRRSEDRDGIRIRRAGGALGFYPVTLVRLLRRRRRTDIVIDPSCGLPSFSPLVLRRRTPVVLVMHHVHQAQFSTHFPAPAAAFGRWLERVAMRRVYRRRRVVAVSPSTLGEMRRQLGWTGDIGILANGSDVPTQEPATAFDPDRIVVLGRLVAHKRVDLVIRALFELRVRPSTAARRLRLDIVGQGPERERLERLVADLGLADRITFHGYVDDATKGELLTGAAVHVCASDAEGWGQAVIDAAAHGVPTLARDVPGLRDSIRDGVTGWLVADAPGDPEEVRRRLSDALAASVTSSLSPAERAARADACRAWARQFDWSRMREQSRALVVEEIVGHAGALPDPHHLPRDTRVAV